MDLFLYDRDLRRERVKQTKLITFMLPLIRSFAQSLL